MQKCLILFALFLVFGSISALPTIAQNKNDFSSFEGEWIFDAKASEHNFTGTGESFPPYMFPCNGDVTIKLHEPRLEISEISYCDSTGVKKRPHNTTTTTKVFFTDRRGETNQKTFFSVPYSLTKSFLTEPDSVTKLEKNKIFTTYFQSDKKGKKKLFETRTISLSKSGERLEMMFRKEPQSGERVNRGYTRLVYHKRK